MATLIFLITLLAIIFFIIQVIIKAIQHKSIKSTVRFLLLVLGAYGLLWLFFYLISAEVNVPPGTDICFDDWCATMSKAERQQTIGDKKSIGQFIILHIRLSNHARGIAQKPSEPRIHILDDKGNSYPYSPIGQQALESISGKQVPIDEKLELHQSLETKLVFDIPENAVGLKVLIEEGPFITRLLLRSDNKVFLVQ